MGFAQFGNDLYTGRRSFDFVGRRRLWYAIAGVVALLCVATLGIQGLNPGIEFRGGSEFRVPQVADTSEITGQDAVTSVVPDSEAARLDGQHRQRAGADGEAHATTETDEVRDGARRGVRRPGGRRSRRRSSGHLGRGRLPQGHPGPGDLPASSSRS